MALDHGLCFMARTVNLCFIVDNWTVADLQYPAESHANVDACHKDMESGSSV